MLSRLSKYASTTVLALTALAASPLAVGAAEYYVSPTAGADKNAGTQLKPWKTLGKACLQARPGDTITLLEGTYREAPFNFELSGTAAKPITIQAATGANVILTYPVTGPKMSTETWPSAFYAPFFKGKKVVCYDSVSQLRGSHLRFRGIAFEGWRDKTTAVNIWAACSGIEICDSSDVVFQQCSFRGNGHCGIKLEAPMNSDMVFEDCLIHDNGTTGFDHGIYLDTGTRITLRRNVFENNQGVGVKLCENDPSFITVEDNTIRHNGEGILLQGHNCVIRRNVIAWNARKDTGEQEPLMGGIVFRGPVVANNLIEDNLVFANSAEFSFDPMGSTFGKNNIVRHNTFNSQPINLATGGVASPNYNYSPVLTDEQAIAVARSWGVIVLTKSKDNVQQLQLDLKNYGIKAAFTPVTDPKLYKFVFDNNVFTTLTATTSTTLATTLTATPTTPVTPSKKKGVKSHHHR